VLLDPDHNELRWPKRLWAKIIKLISRDPKYSPAIAFAFGHEPSSVFPRIGFRYPFPARLEGTLQPPSSLTNKTLAAIKREIQLYRQMGQI